VSNATRKRRQNGGDMAYLDLQRWARRDAFEFFRGFDKPYFNVCVRLDVAALKAAAAACGVGSFTLAYHFIALRLANLHGPFRYRLEGGRVRVHEVVHAGATVLREDDSFGFAYLDHATDYASFARSGAEAMAQARARHATFEPRLDATDVIHTTTLPLIPFTSFSHARNWGREDSVPKLAFGRADRDGSRLWMPFSVEVHHALMDGLHVGRYIQAFEAALREPERWLEDRRLP
jgi:chloramphenicol O-acetyltransferase type A